MEIKQSTRIQTSILNGLEKKALVWIAGRLPHRVTSDMLTWFGLFGSFLCGLGFFLTHYSIYWLWLSCAGLLVNWFGDSLDGTLARVHHQQRPLYGYYLDHNIDTVTEAFMFIGAGLSPLMNLGIAALCYAAYLALTVYVSINAHLKGEFKLTYGKMGPTEFRLIIIIANILLMYVPALTAFQGSFQWFDKTITYGSLDVIGTGILLILAVFYFISFFKDLHWFAEKDPLIKNK
ncbi:MAG: CDP-alcohol phosphatidyltransferase family protein [Paludibacteraceae bacterium]|nr:CDP-alcohol phosphatidyltransferase family protein [Paludibacteraceae bacterium]